MRRALIVSFILAIALISALFVQRRFARKITQDDQPATTRATHPSPPPDTDALQNYFALLKTHYPHFPATQPLPHRIDFRYAGRFILPHPVYLDRSTIYRSNLWITHPDAPPTTELLDQDRFDQVILTRLKPVFVHWRLAPNRILQPHIISQAESGQGYEVHSSRGRQPIGRNDLHYDWSRATSMNDRFVVPTAAGISVFTVGSSIEELPSPPLENNVVRTPVEYQFEGNGLIAWVPPSRDHPGSSGVIRFATGKWTRLSSEDWPNRILHLIPFLDGSILQLIEEDVGVVRLNMVQPQAQPVDPRRVAVLVGELSDADPKVRDKAFKELSQFGPGAHPLIEKMIDGEPPETQSRLRDLLRSRVTPLLGHMRLLPGKLRLLSRHPDGGALFLAENGVSIPRGDQPAQIVRPAWLSIRPGQSVSLLDPPLVRDLDPDKVTLTPYFNEWIVTDDIHGPRRYFGNSLVPLLRKHEREYSHFIGIDAEGRFLFRRPQSDSPAAALTETLIIDPNLPDPTPRLPGWEINDKAATAGWDSNHYPALSKGASAAALRESDWRFLDLSKERFFSQSSDIPPIQPTTRPSSATTLPSDPLLIDQSGNTYYDGKTALTLLRPDGSMFTWPLPPAATGDGPVFLIEARDKTLFLFNQPGRLLRIRPPAKPAETFTLESTFTRHIPNTQNISRLWLDPLNRIVIAHSASRLTLLFPEGYIPPSTASLLPPDDADE